MQIRILAFVLIVIVSAGGCQSYERFSVSVRDYNTQQPVSTLIASDYPFNTELSRAFDPFKPELETDSMTTDAQGNGSLRVAKGVNWYIRIDLPEFKEAYIDFKPGLEVDHATGPIEQRDGWLRPRILRHSADVADLEVLIRPAK